MKYIRQLIDTDHFIALSKTQYLFKYLQMTVLFIFLIGVLIASSYLFFAPFYFEINTVEETCRFRFHKIAGFEIKLVNDTVILEIRIAGWRKQLDLLKMKKVQKAPVKNEKRKNTKIKLQWKRIGAVLASFKINKCDISIDTTDQQLNGILYPAAYLFRFYTKKNIYINFTGENQIILEVENNLARMSWAYFSSGYKLKNKNYGKFK